MKTEFNPYSPPQSGIDPGKEFRSFRIKAWPISLAIAVGLFVVVGLLGILWPQATGFQQGVGIPLGVVYTLVYSLVSGFAIAFLMKIHVCDEGLKCPNFWGRYSFVPWTAMQQAVPIYYLPLPYLRIYAMNLRLPLFLKDELAFWKMVLPWLEPDSLLVEFARNRGYETDAYGRAHAES